MKKLLFILALIVTQLSSKAQQMVAEDYFVSAFNEMSDMLEGRDSLSIKRAVYLAEWAYYEGNLDYQNDFCNEIDRITAFVNLFYSVNNLKLYKTGKQMSLNEYFFRPYSGNNYHPYTYDFDDYSEDVGNFEGQFVCKVLKTHKGQCRSLPWMYKIIANEIGADVSLAPAPKHCYIMYKDEDNLTPEDWINLELTTHQMHPAFWIQQDFEICDSAILVGTYMTPLSDIETVACQLSDLALGYREKFHRYDEFTFYCVDKALEFYPMNPNAWFIRGKSLERMIQDYITINGCVFDDYLSHLLLMMEETKFRFDKTYMTADTEEMRIRRSQQVIDAQKYTQENLLP